jgi:hypothetical protein
MWKTVHLPATQHAQDGNLGRHAEEIVLHSENAVVWCIDLR